MASTPTAVSSEAVRLAPGVHVVPRDDDHVQVGLDPPARVIVRRDPELLSVLECLRRGWPHPLSSPAAVGLRRALDAAGLLAAPAPRHDGTVTLLDHGLGLGPLVRLLRSSGVAAVVGSAGSTPPDLYLVGSAAVLPRSVLDEWLCDGTPHLVVAGTGRPGSLRVGPLVEPGVTACLRCVDAAESEHDPRRSLVLEQLAALPAAPLDPPLVALALAWAAREATAYVGGQRPLTWSGTVDLTGSQPVVQTWDRHPHCGCAWDDLPY